MTEKAPVFEDFNSIAIDSDLLPSIGEAALTNYVQTSLPENRVIRFESHL